MAEIKFTAFVNDWKKDSTDRHPNWMMKTAESHRKKVDDQWVTSGTTYRTVKNAYGVDIDFTQFSPGDRVEIEGTEVTETWESNGKKGNTLVVKARTVSFIMPGDQRGNTAVGSHDAFPASPVEPVDESLPF